MKLVAAIIAHETNTFSPLPTRLSDFGPDGPIYGPSAYKAVKGGGRAMAGMIAAAEAAGAEIDLVVFGNAAPSRAVDQDAFEAMWAPLGEAVAAGCDGILLEMHGAMVAAHHDDGEGEILERLRAIAPSLPIAVALDLHGNISARSVRHATTLVGYKTYPHVDIVETGFRAAELLMRTMRGEVTPTLAHLDCRMMPNLLRMATADGPMAELIAAARAAEDEGALAVSVFGGFPLADCPDAGMSIVAMTDGDPEGAHRICRRLRDLAWSRRHDFQIELEPLAQTIRRAAELRRVDPAGGPILLVDHADNCNSGGTQDSMDVIAEALRQGLTGIAAGPIRDPDAVAVLIEAGLGADVAISVGGKTDFAQVGGSVGALDLRGRVTCISDGRFVVEGPVFHGTKVDLGRTAVLTTDRLQLIVSERRCEPLDLANFTFVGIDPTKADVLIIKSKIQYRPTFGAIASHVLECNGVGYASLDVSKFRFRKLRRPRFPFDDEMLAPAAAGDRE